MEKEVLVQAEHISKEFKVKNGIIKAVSDVSLQIYRGETLALVGESGCGKSTLGRMLLQTVRPDGGKVFFDGVDMTELKKGELRQMRKRMQLIFQNPYASLNPRMTIEEIIGEPLVAFKISKEERTRIILELTQRVGIPREYLNRYPHEFSGGQRQRIGIARALSINPEFVVCDEPVSALDVSIQAQILNLLLELQHEMKLTYLFISHDLGVVNYISDRVCVMFLGQICEIGKTEDIFFSPRHPYTKMLLDSTPAIGKKIDYQKISDNNAKMQSAINPFSGCHFQTRCPYAQEICTICQPVIRGAGSHKCACHLFSGVN